MSKELKTRRPRARHKDIVFGALDERLGMVAEASTPEVVASNVARIRELVDELRRACSKEGGEES